MAGIVFAKFTKPTNRAETILFSSNALVTLRNGSYYLLCRIGDMRWGLSLIIVMVPFSWLMSDQLIYWSPTYQDIFSPKRTLRRERSEQCFSVKCNISFNWNSQAYSIFLRFWRTKIYLIIIWISGNSLSPKCYGVWGWDGWQPGFLPDVLASCRLS